MKSWRGIILLLAFLLSQSAFGGKDPYWMFSDQQQVVIYNQFLCHDTTRIKDVFTWAPDTQQANTYNGSQYLDFNYQFNTNVILDTFSFVLSGVTYYDTNYFDNPRPGFAGFKTAWDLGMTGFPIARYKYLIIPHKGPLPTHKVTIRAWYNNGTCGAASNNELLGTLTASDAWRVDTIALPDSFQNKADIVRNKSKYYELVFLINNIDPNGPATSDPGNFCFDEMRIAGRNPIDTSPKAQVANTGQPATFQVWTSPGDSADVMTYQWKKGGDAIAGATNATYTISSVKLSDAGAYTVAVTVNSNLTFTSQQATLTVNPGTLTAPSITTQPQSATVAAGGSVTFTVVATGTPAPTYQWSKNGNPISGATSSTYAIASAQSSDAGSYTVVVTNSQGSVTSNAAVLTVQTPETKKCGCGSGTGLALIPPIWFKARSLLKRKKRGSQA